jgi:hypothetical protein
MRPLRARGVTLRMIDGEMMMSGCHVTPYANDEVDA